MLGVEAITGTRKQINKLPKQPDIFLRKEQLDFSIHKDLNTMSVLNAVETEVHLIF
jgi:hypothetical protein